MIESRCAREDSDVSSSHANAQPAQRDAAAMFHSAPTSRSCSLLQTRELCHHGPSPQRAHRRMSPI
jgi:hypothetical protein